GTFDPPHLAHCMTASYVLGLPEIEALWILPVAHHPLAKEPSDFEHRMAMCRLAFSIFGERVHVRDDEARSSGRTWDLLVALRDRYPHRSFRLVLGTDQRELLHRWFRFEDISEFAPPIWVGRAGYGDAHLEPIVLPDYSSTEAQKLLSTDVVPAWVSDEVASYAKDHRLYPLRGSGG
ncbi:MAG TPA: hypothetical protein DCQ06_02005, partial [Myxococcales bacterium]|nr:hypothetical protein [Myxococcales bacterium]